MGESQVGGDGSAASGWVVSGYLLAFSTFYFAFSPFASNMPDWIAALSLAVAAIAHAAFLLSFATYPGTASNPDKGGLLYRAKVLVDGSGGPWWVALLLGWQNLFLFAALYLEAEFWQAGPTFTANLNSQVDGIYFSVITLFTIGYGDIAPVTSFTRLLVTMQVVLGWVTLALLGASVSKSVSRTP